MKNMSLPVFGQCLAGLNQLVIGELAVIGGDHAGDIVVGGFRDAQPVSAQFMNKGHGAQHKELFMGKMFF